MPYGKGQPRRGVLQREPVIVALVPALFAEAGGAVLLLARDHTTYGLFAAGAAFLTGVGGVLARNLVTPTSPGGS